MAPEDIKQQIDDKLKSSPVNKPSVSAKVVNPSGDNRQIVDFNEVLQQANVAMMSQSDRIKLSQPIDRSQGIIEPDYVGKPTKRVATTRTLSTKGAKDIEQFEYPLDDSRGATVEGSEEDGILLGSRDMGVAFGGEHLAASGDLRNMDGSEGNPYFLKDKTPSIFKEVAPFSVSLPAYNLEVQSKTTNRAKLAYQLATSIQGEPEDYFIGYERIPDSKEGFWSGLQKGISTGATDLAHSVAKGGIFALGLLSQGAHKVYGHIIGADDEWFDMAEKEIEDNVSYIAEYVDKLNQQYTRWADSELTPNAGIMASVGKSLPSAMGQIGLMSIGGAGGNWLMQIIMGGMQGQATWEAMEGLGLSASERNWRALGSAGLSTILNRIGILSMAQSRLAVTRRFASSTWKRMASVGAQSLLGATAEGITELGDELVQDMFAMNIKDDNFSQRMDNYVTSLLAGAISGLVSLPTNIRAEQYAIASEKVLANKLGKSASQLEASLKKFAVAAENAGLMSAKEAMDLAYIMSLPAAQAQMNEAMRRNIDAIYDRADPKLLKELTGWTSKDAAEAMQDYKNLDTKVMQALPKDMKESTKVMVTRAMRGVASVLSIYAHKDIKIPAFKYRAGLSEYDPKTNTIYISRNLQSTTEADQFVRNRDLKKISPEQRSLLHEIGHMLDVQFGTGSRLKDFLPAYFNAIAKVFGQKRAVEVEKAMPKSKKRVGNVKNQADYLSNKNTTEWFAYSLGRLGKAAGDAIGLTGDIAHHVDVANVMAKQLLIPELQAALTEYNNAMAELIKQNDDTLIAMAKAAGEKGLAESIERYIAGDDSAMSKEDVAALYRVLKSYVGSEGAKILSEAFANVSAETFMERTNREFRESIEYDQKRGKKKIEDVELEDFGGEDGYTPEDIYSLNERPIGYQATPTARYDNPSVSTSGSGSGIDAQAWGSYFAENKDLDKGVYFSHLGIKKHALPLVVEVEYISGADGNTEVKTLSPADVEQYFGDGIYDEMLGEAGASVGLAEEAYEVTLKDGNDLADFMYDNLEKKFKIDPAMVTRISIDIDQNYDRGQIMEAILPDTDNMLVSESPISSQNEKVRAVIEKAARDRIFDENGKTKDPADAIIFGVNNIDEAMKKLNGWQFYNMLVSTFENEANPRKAASLYLLDNGVEGMEFEMVDHSRGWSVFDPDTVEPVRIARGASEIRLFEMPSMAKLNETQPLPMNEKTNPFRRKQTHLERRIKASKKVGGVKSFDENVKKITEILSAKDYKPVSKFFTKVFGGYGSGDINTYLNMISPEIQKEFDLVEGFATAEADALSAMREMWEDAGLTNRYKRNVFINNLNQPSIIAKHVDDGMGGYMTTTITPNQALNIYLGAKTKARSNWIATFGGDESEMEAVIDQLTPEQKAFGDAMQKFLRKKYLNRKVYTEEELLDMSDKTREELGLAPDESLDVPAFLAEQDLETLYWPRLSMSHDLDERRPNYDIARKAAPDDPSSFKVPATETVGSYIYRMSAGKSDVYTKIRRIKDLFFYNESEETGNMDKKAKLISEHVQKESMKLRRRAMKAFGNSERTMENFRNLLDDYLNGVHDKEVGTDLVNKIMRNYIAGQIAWKPIQFLKNTMNIFMFWGMAPKQGQYWADTAWAATHWSEAKQFMIDKVPWMRTRYENAEMDEQLRQSTSASDSMLMTWAEGKNLSEGSRNAVSNIVAISQAAKRVGYAPMMAGDAVSNIVGGYGVLKQYIEMYGEAEGVRMFTQQLATKQSNTNRAVKSLMQREWNKGFRGQFIAFMSEPIGKTKSMALAIENANRGEITWKQAGMEIASTFMSIAMFSLISSGVVDLFDEDEENDEEVYKALGREAISMITGFHPLGGSVLAPMVSELFLDGQQSISSPFTTGVFRALNALEDGDWSKIAGESAGATGMIIGAGVLEDMLTGLARTLSDDEAYAESGWRMLSGESESRAEKRAGYKEPVEKNEDE